MRLLISNRVFKIGSSIKSDLTRVKKQFPQLANQVSFNTIDLKDYCLRRGIISRKESGSLDHLLEKTTQMYLSKDENLRKTEDWEVKKLCADLLHYAAKDVFASHIIYEKATEATPLDRVEYDSPAGTQIAVLVQEGGEVAAYGKISSFQPASLNNIRVKVPSKSRLVVDVETIIIPSAAAILHISHNSSLPNTQRTKPGALTLAQLQAASSTPAFQVVVPLSLLDFDHRKQVCILYFSDKVALILSIS